MGWAAARTCAEGEGVTRGPAARWPWAGDPCGGGSRVPPCPARRVLRARRGVGPATGAEPGTAGREGRACTGHRGTGRGAHPGAAGSWTPGLAGVSLGGERAGAGAGAGMAPSATRGSGGAGRKREESGSPHARCRTPVRDPRSPHPPRRPPPVGAAAASMRTGAAAGGAEPRRGDAGPWAAPRSHVRLLLAAYLHLLQPLPQGWWGGHGGPGPGERTASLAPTHGWLARPGPGGRGSAGCPWSARPLLPPAPQPGSGWRARGSPSPQPAGAGALGRAERPGR